MTDWNVRRLPLAGLRWAVPDPAIDPWILPAAVLLDMDGTLTEPILDFRRIKEAMGIAPDRPILEALEAFSPSDRVDAERILHRFEDEAARLSTLNPGCREILASLDAKNVPTALITRNSRASVRTVLATHGLPIDVLITREDAVPKPDPAPLFEACRRLQVPPSRAGLDGRRWGIRCPGGIECGHADRLAEPWSGRGRSRPLPGRSRSICGA